MVVHDDMETSEKIKVYDRGVEVKEEDAVHTLPAAGCAYMRAITCSAPTTNRGLGLCRQRKGS